MQFVGRIDICESSAECLVRDFNQKKKNLFGTVGCLDTYFFKQMK